MPEKEQLQSTAVASEEEHEEEQQEQQQEEEEAAPEPVTDLKAAGGSGEHPRPGKAGLPKKKPGNIDGATKSLYQKIKNDRKKVAETAARLQGLSGEVLGIDTDDKKNSVLDKLLEEHQVIDQVLFRTANQYYGEAKALPVERNRKHGEARIGRLDQKARETMGVYDAHRKTLRVREAEYKSDDLAGRLRELRSGRHQAITGGKTPNYYEYRVLHHRLEDLAGERAALPSPESDRARNRQAVIDRHIVNEREKLKQLEAALPKEDQERLKKKRGEEKEEEKFLNSRYSPGMPFIRLLWKSAEVKDKHKSSSRWDKFKEGVQGAAEGAKEKYDQLGEPVLDVAEEVVDFKLKDWLVKHGKDVVLWLMGKLGAGETAQLVADEVMEELADWFEPMVALGKFLKGMKSYIDNTEDMSREEAKNKAADAIGTGIESALGMLEKLLDLLKIVPYFGEIAGIVNGAVGVVQHTLRFLDKRKFQTEASESKEALKERMHAKRIKYAGMEELKSLNLYGFAGTSSVDRGFLWRKKVQETHVAKESSREKWHKKDSMATTDTVEEQQAQLTAEVGGGNIYDQLEEMKQRKYSGTFTQEERQRYYKMKTLRTIREYTEQKASKRANKMRMKSEGLEIAHSAVDIISSACALMPGLGSAISGGVKLFQATSKVVQSTVSIGSKIGQAISGTKKKKTEARDGMAENIFNQMLFVTNYMRPEKERGPLFRLGSGTAKRVSGSVRYLESTTTTLSYKMSEMLKITDKESLLEMMSSAFGAEG